MPFWERAQQRKSVMIKIVFGVAAGLQSFSVKHCLDAASDSEDSWDESQAPMDNLSSNISLHISLVTIYLTSVYFS